MIIRELLPRACRPHRIRRGPLRGKTIWTSWYEYPRAIVGLAESPLCEWILQHAQPGETWIDVGAHHGVTALAMCEAVGSNGRVVAFEPALASAGLLARTREANRLWQLIVVPMALGDSELVKLLRVSNQSKGMIGIVPKMRQGNWPATGEVIYEGAFDRIWPTVDEGNNDVHGVKIDVQGAEAYVIRGMRQALVANRPRLVVEYHDYADADDLGRALEASGYSREHRDVDMLPQEHGSELVHGRNYEFVAHDTTAHSPGPCRPTTG